MAYRWANPQEWLSEKAGEWSHEELLSEFRSLVDKQDADSIQDIYQDEMDADGYFDEK